MSQARTARRRRKQYLSNNAQWSGRGVRRQWGGLRKVKMPLKKGWRLRWP